MLQLTDEDVLGIQAGIQVQDSIVFLYFLFTDFYNMPQTAKQTKNNICKTLSMNISTLCVNRYQLFMSMFFFVQDLSQMFHVSSGNTIV